MVLFILQVLRLKQLLDGPYLGYGMSFLGVFDLKILHFFFDFPLHFLRFSCLIDLKLTFVTVDKGLFCSTQQLCTDHFISYMFWYRNHKHEK